MFAGVVAVVGLAGVLLHLVTAGNDGERRFEDAAETCESPYVQVLDDGAGLSVSSVGEEQPGAEWSVVLCVISSLDMPDTVVSRMNGTRALDGTQDAQWDGIQASWTYHPDSGMSLIMEKE